MKCPLMLTTRAVYNSFFAVTRPFRSLLESACLQLAAVRARACVLAMLALSAPFFMARVPLIVDTDMSFDVDDVMAVCMAHALHDNGEARLLAIVHDAGYPEGVHAASVLSHYYGHDDVPLGAYKGAFGRDLDHPTKWKTGDYVPTLTSGRWAAPITSSAQVADAVVAYRRALAAADDRGDERGGAVLHRACDEWLVVLNRHRAAWHEQQQLGRPVLAGDSW